MEGVPWDVNWNRSFEQKLHSFSDSGAFYDNLCGTVEKIIRDPIRTGKYKGGSLENVRTTHVEQHIIGWEVDPGVNQVSLQDKVEEVYFLFLEHHDDMSTGITNKNPAKKSTIFEIEAPYSDNLHSYLCDIHEFVEQFDDGSVEENWRDEYVCVMGHIPPEARREFESLIGESATVEYDDPTLI